MMELEKVVTPISSVLIPPPLPDEVLLATVELINVSGPPGLSRILMPPPVPGVPYARLPLMVELTT